MFFFFFAYNKHARSVLCQIEDPGRLWARVLKGPGIQPDSPEEYENLRVKMNLFYHEVDLDVQKLKPSELKEGLVCHFSIWIYI